MAHFYASCPQGMADLVEKELQSFGLKTWEKTAGGVVFESNWAGCYKANLNSRYASRILKPVLDFPAYQNDELYHNIRKHDFTKYIKPDQTLAIDVVVKDCKLNDQRFVAMKIKDAIVDQFREKFGVRPDVDSKEPDLRIHVRGNKNNFAVSVDTSGHSLFMRGYRLKTGEAPLKENLAAGLLGLAEWDKKTAIVDLFCGSGTILIEAAMMALNIAPGLQRKSFGFMNLLDFDEDVWEKVVQEAIEGEKEELDFKFYGHDIDKKVLDIAKKNAKSAGVAEFIEFKTTPVAVALPPEEKCIVICNPPYGSRIGDEDNLKDVYRDLGFTLKHRFTGCEAWVLSGNKDIMQEMKLKSTRRHFVYNGNIECRFLKYEMYEGSHRKPKEEKTTIRPS
jgi:23S rRNA G2445 N2-methylase RlmL